MRRQNGSEALSPGGFTDAHKDVMEKEELPEGNYVMARFGAGRSIRRVLPVARA